MRRRVIVESPFQGQGNTPAARAADEQRNINYARAAMYDCLQRAEAPFASHLLYTQPGVLKDAQPVERRLGIAAGLAWGAAADLTVVYTDLGISAGMEQGILRAVHDGREVEQRTLGYSQRYCCTCWVCIEGTGYCYGAEVENQLETGRFHCSLCHTGVGQKLQEIHCAGRPTQEQKGRGLAPGNLGVCGAEGCLTVGTRLEAEAVVAAGRGLLCSRCWQPASRLTCCRSYDLGLTSECEQPGNCQRQEQERAAAERRAAERRTHSDPEGR